MILLCGTMHEVYFRTDSSFKQQQDPTEQFDRQIELLILNTVFLNVECNGCKVQQEYLQLMGDVQNQHREEIGKLEDGERERAKRPSCEIICNRRWGGCICKIKHVNRRRQRPVPVKRTYTQVQKSKTLIHLMEMLELDCHVTLLRFQQKQDCNRKVNYLLESLVLVFLNLLVAGSCTSSFMSPEQMCLFMCAVLFSKLLSSSPSSGREQGRRRWYK